MKKQFLAIALTLGLVFAGCSFSDGVAQLDKYLPVALQAFEGVLAILAETGAIKVGEASTLTAAATEVNKDFGDLQAAVNSYEQVKGTDSSALTKVTQAIGVIEGDLGVLEQDAHIKDSKAQTTVEAALLLIQTTLGSIEAGLTPTSSVQAKKAAQKLTVKSFKHSYNGIVSQGGYPEHELR